jgi:hypothetical protein
VESERLKQDSYFKMNLSFVKFILLVTLAGWVPGSCGPGGEVH